MFAVWSVRNTTAALQELRLGWKGIVLLTLVGVVLVVAWVWLSILVAPTGNLSSISLAVGIVVLVHAVVFVAARSLANGGWAKGRSVTLQEPSTIVIQDIGFSLGLGLVAVALPAVFYAPAVTGRSTLLISVPLLYATAKPFVEFLHFTCENNRRHVHEENMWLDGLQTDLEMSQGRRYPTDRSSWRTRLSLAIDLQSRLAVAAVNMSGPGLIFYAEQVWVGMVRDDKPDWSLIESGSEGDMCKGQDINRHRSVKP